MMIRSDIALLALALAASSVACGGSDAPAKDPSTDPAATMPADPAATPAPPASAGTEPAAPAPGTGTPAGQ